MSDLLPVSVLLLARDEASRLDALLPSLGRVREVVVVVDAATRDGTRQAAERHGARVFERPLEGFGPQRQFALDQCREEWVLWLDADERLDQGAWTAIAEATRRPAASAFRLERRTWFLGRRIRFCGWRGERVTRLFRRRAARFDDAALHERVWIDGETEDLDALIEHRSYQSWADCRDKLWRYAEAGAESLRRRGRRASAADVLLRPPLRFLRMYVLQLGFLDGAHGAVLCLLASAQVLLKYAELWARPPAGGAGARRAPDRPEPGARSG